MIEPGLVDRLDGLVVGLFAQVDAADFRADMFGQRNDIEGALPADDGFAEVKGEAESRAERDMSDLR